MPERSAVVTGASTGIGRAAALFLDRDGFRVFAGVRRPEDADALRTDGSERITPVILDVTHEASIEAAVKLVDAAVGSAGLGGLVNNAGIAVGGVLEFLDLDELRRQLEVNVVGLVAATRGFLPLLRRGEGRVVNISSNGGYMASPFLGPYSASKFAVEAITDTLRRELRPWGLHAAAIEPGSIDTEIWNKAKSQTEQIREKLPEHGIELYGPVFSRMESYIRRTAKRAIPPEAVAKAIHHALTARRPRTRYRVGSDARAGWWLSRLLSDRALDALIARMIGIPRRV
jgi:NAD(P)-dependent dehydrogenase (short-subunit alcohol dehydrogenase family)